MSLARKIARRKLLEWRKARVKQGLPPGLIISHDDAGRVYIEGQAEPLPDVVAEHSGDGVKYVVYI